MLAAVAASVAAGDITHKVTWWRHYWMTSCCCTHTHSHTHRHTFDEQIISAVHYVQLAEKNKRWTVSLKMVTNFIITLTDFLFQRT